MQKTGMKKRQINFIDEQIIDCLIFFTHFLSKFAADSIHTDLADKVAPSFEPINYDRQTIFEYKNELVWA